MTIVMEVTHFTNMTFAKGYGPDRDKMAVDLHKNADQRSIWP